MLELMIIRVNFEFWNLLPELGCFAQVLLVQWWKSDDTAFLPLLLLKIRSFKMLDTIVC